LGRFFDVFTAVVPEDSTVAFGWATLQNFEVVAGTTAGNVQQVGDLTFSLIGLQCFQQDGLQNLPPFANANERSWG
jgi:hypothetical protein